MRSSPPVTPKTKRTYKPRRRNSTTSVSPGRGSQGPARLKQIQYRSYQHEILIYHFRTKHLSVSEFRSLLSRDTHGYVDTLISTDTLAQKPVPKGDKVPRNCIEAAYFPNVFSQNGARSTGSALGFRVGNNVIDWVCFDRPIDTSILDSWIGFKTPFGLQVHAQDIVPANHPRRLFDLVGSMPKGISQRRVRGANYEHKQWHDALWEAKLRLMTLRLTWRNYTAELMDHHTQQRAKAKIRAEAEGLRRLKQEAIEQQYRDEDLDVDMVGGYV